MSMLACQYNQSKRPGDLALCPFDLESGIRVTCDVGYLCTNLVFLGLSVLDLGPMYAIDRRKTSISHKSLSKVLGNKHRNYK